GGDGELGGARGGGGPRARPRPGGGRPRARRLSVPTAPRPPAVSRTDFPGHPRTGADAGAGAAVAFAAEDAARPGDDLPEGAGQGAGPPLPDRARAGGRPAPLPEGRADSRQTGGPPGAPGEVGA